MLLLLPDAALPLCSSLDFLLLPFLLVDSRAVCCGDVSGELPDEGPTLDISAGAADAFFLLLFRLSAGVAVVSVSLCSALPPRARLLGLRAGWLCAGESIAALRLREAALVGGRVVDGGEPASVAVVAGEPCVVFVSALTLAAEERVTLWDICK